MYAALFGKKLKDWHSKSRRLSRARLGAAQKILLFQDRRDRLLLNRSRGGICLLFQCVQDGWDNPQLLKCHIGSFTIYIFQGKMCGTPSICISVFGGRASGFRTQFKNSRFFDLPCRLPWPGKTRNDLQMDRFRWMQSLRNSPRIRAAGGFSSICPSIESSRAGQPSVPPTASPQTCPL